MSYNWVLMAQSQIVWAIFSRIAGGPSRSSSNKTSRAAGAIARTSLKVSPSCRLDSSLIVSTHSLRFFQSGIVWTLTLNNAAISASVRFLAYLSAAALRNSSASSTAFADSGLGLSGFSEVIFPLLVALGSVPQAAAVRARRQRQMMRAYVGDREC